MRRWLRLDIYIWVNGDKGKVYSLFTYHLPTTNGMLVCQECYIVVLVLALALMLVLAVGFAWISSRGGTCVPPRVRWMKVESKCRHQHPRRRHRHRGCGC